MTSLSLIPYIIFFNKYTIVIFSKGENINYEVKSYAFHAYEVYNRGIAMNTHRTAAYPSEKSYYIIVL